VSGYLGGRLGLGQAARGYVTALRAGGAVVGTRVLRPDAPPRPDGVGPPVPQRAAADEPVEEPLPDGREPDVELVCVNADQLADALPAPDDDASRPYVIGQWAWETDAIPERWDAAFALVDEVWVYSTYVAEQIGRASPVPVIPVPLPVEPPAAAAGPVPFDLDPDAFVFLFVLDHLSTVERKNPLGLIEAFRRAFDPGAGPRLVVKTINGHLRPEAHEHLRYASGGRKDILVADASLPGDALAALFARADCYVSLHRSEGFGLTLAEAMILGKPVIGTAYGGNTDFMTPLNSYLVDWTLREVGPEAEHYPAAGHWAEPSVEHAAALMRAVVDDPGEAARRGARARGDIEAALSPAAVGSIARARLDRIVRAPDRFPDVGGADALDEVEHRLAFDLAGGAGAAGMRGTARRAVLRALKPYTSAERALDRATATAVRRLWVELEAERAGRARDRARVAQLERRLAALERERRA
jgi:glycosyltransferase involved in cell wall biosynthesis